MDIRKSLLKRGHWPKAIVAESSFANHIIGPRRIRKDRHTMKDTTSKRLEYGFGTDGESGWPAGQLKVYTSKQTPDKRTPAGTI